MIALGKRRLSLICILLVSSVLLFGGCGGGGDSGSPVTPVDPVVPDEPTVEEVVGDINDGMISPDAGGAYVVLDGSSHVGTAYGWKLTSSPMDSKYRITSSDEAATLFYGNTPGAYALDLTVSTVASGDVKFPYLVTLSVNEDPDKVPIASVAVSKKEGETTSDSSDPRFVYLDGRGSRGITYRWTVSGFVKSDSARVVDDASPVFTASTSPVTGFYGDRPGTYTVALEVGNGRGQTAVTSLDIVLIDDEDGDGRPDSVDPDRDGDGFVNSDDRFPDDKASHLKWSGRGDPLGNYYVMDEDGDAFSDIVDKFPFSADKQAYPEYAELETDGNTNDGISVSENYSSPLSVPVMLEGKVDSSGNRPDIDYFAVAFSEEGTYSVLLSYEGEWSPTLAMVADGGTPLTGSELETGEGKVAMTFIAASEDIKGYLVVTDGSGKSDSLWSYSAGIFKDSDSDGVPDETEDALDSNKYNSDSDGDGISDLVEISPGLENWSMADPDGDGLPSWWDLDSDGDGIPDSEEFLTRAYGAAMGMTDSEIDGWNDADGDGYPNFLDEDSDNPAVGMTVETFRTVSLVMKDGEEAGSIPISPLDTDGDGFPDFMDGDNDGDGLLDENESDRDASLTELGFSDDMSLTRMVDLSKNVENVVVSGDLIKVEGMNLPDAKDDIFLVISGVDRSTSVNLLVEDVQSGDVLFTWPAGVSPGTVNFFLVYGNKRTNGLNPLVVDGDGPILTGVSYDVKTDATVFEGYNLQNNINVNFTGGTYSYNNSWGSDRGFSIFALPTGAQSGPVYLTLGTSSTNSLWLQLKRSVSGTIVLPSGSSVPMRKLSVAWDLFDEVSPNGDGSFVIPVDIDKPTIVTALVELGEDDYATFLQGLALDGDNFVTLDSGGTALSMVWATVIPERIVSEDNLTDLRKALVDLPEVKSLADLLETKIASDPSILRKSDSEIHDSLKAASEAAAQVIQDDFSIKTGASLFRTVGAKMDGFEVTPSEVDDISVYEVSGSGNVGVENDSLLYMSAQVTTTDGKVVLKHSARVPDMIGPQGYSMLFIASTKDLDVPKYKNCVVQILTAGVNRDYDPKSKPAPLSVWKWLYMRSVVEKAIFPPIASLIGLKYDPSFWPNLLMTYTPNIVDMALQGDAKGAVGSALSTLKQDALGAPPGPIMTAIAKKYGKSLAEKALKKFAAKIAAKFIPVVGQISLALDVAGHVSNGVTASKAITDIMTTDSLIDYKVTFPVALDEVRPSKVKPTGSDIQFIVVGKGFCQVVRGIWPFRRFLDPKIKLIDAEGNEFETDATWIASDGSRMLFNVSGWWLERAKDNAEKGGGDTIDLVVHHPVDESDAKYTKNDAIQIVTDVSLSSIDPDKGAAGSKADLYGTGFSSVTGDNEVMVGDKKALITSGNEAVLGIVIPGSLDPGTYGVKARCRTDGIWSEWSNSLSFEIQEGEASITVMDSGGLKDDAFALYVDGKYIGTMYANNSSYSKTWKLSLSPGTHSAMLLGVEAPDSIGTYRISFAGVSNVTGDPTSGSDLVPGVSKHYTFTVSSSSGLPNYTIKSLPYNPPLNDGETRR